MSDYSTFLESKRRQFAPLGECAEAGRNERYGIWGGRYRRPGLTDWRTPMLALLRHPHTAPQIADALDADIRNTYRRLRILTAEGRLTVTPQPDGRPTVYHLKGSET